MVAVSQREERGRWAGVRLLEDITSVREMVAREAGWSKTMPPRRLEARVVASRGTARSNTCARQRSGQPNIESLC